jgi:hypothetical protein
MKAAPIESAIQCAARTRTKCFASGHGTERENWGRLAQDK